MRAMTRVDYLQQMARKHHHFLSLTRVFDGYRPMRVRILVRTDCACEQMGQCVTLRFWLRIVGQLPRLFIEGLAH